MNGEVDRGATPTILSLRAREEVPEIGVMVRDKYVMMRNEAVLPDTPRPLSPPTRRPAK